LVVLTEAARPCGGKSYATRHPRWPGIFRGVTQLDAAAMLLDDAPDDCGPNPVPFSASYVGSSSRLQFGWEDRYRCRHVDHDIVAFTFGKYADRALAELPGGTAAIASVAFLMMLVSACDIATGQIGRAWILADFGIDLDLNFPRASEPVCRTASATSSTVIRASASAQNARTRHHAPDILPDDKSGRALFEDATVLSDHFAVLRRGHSES
jgi:hypothetical protein